jgi:hypothetical protein
MEKLSDGRWRWTARHPEWHPSEFGAEVACFAVQAGDTTLLIDPLLPADARTAAAHRCSLSVQGRLGKRGARVVVVVVRGCDP